jgi:hypothetical protein
MWTSKGGHDDGKVFHPQFWQGNPPVFSGWDELPASSFLKLFLISSVEERSTINRLKVAGSSTSYKPTGL